MALHCVNVVESSSAGDDVIGPVCESGRDVVQYEAF